MKLQEQKNGQKMVTIPRDLAKAMGWEKGDELKFSVEGRDSLKVKKT